MTNHLKALDLSLPVGNLGSYTHWANQIPMLTAEEEYRLAVRFRDHQDRDAARGLIMPHLRYVIKVAKGYIGYGLPEADLIQEGNIGLMKAVKRFDPEVGVRLVTFAMHWIKAEIHEFILRNWRIVKIATTKAQRKLFFNLRQAKKQLGWFSQEEVQEVAENLKVSTDAVLQMEARMYAPDAALENSSDDETHTAPIYYLEDARNNPAHLLEATDSEDDNKSRLHYALANLDERSRAILEKRWLAEKKSTLHELAAEFNVSAERIRQLEKQAMERLKEALGESES